MANRLSESQTMLLLELMEQYPLLAQTTIGLGKKSNQTIAQLWSEVAEQLNSVGNGTTKSADSWKKYWINLKSRIRMKAALERKDRNATGGGPNAESGLSEFDQRVLALIGKEAAEGDEALKHKALLTEAPPSLFLPSRASAQRCPSPLPGPSCSEPFPRSPESFRLELTPSPQPHRAMTPSRHGSFVSHRQSLTPSPQPPRAETPSRHGCSPTMARTGPTRACATFGGSAPARVAMSGAAPAGVTIGGAGPARTTIGGSAPARAAPVGAVPAGAMAARNAPACATPGRAAPAGAVPDRAVRARRTARRKAPNFTHPQRMPTMNAPPPGWFSAGEVVRAESADRRAAEICAAVERVGERQERAIDRLTAVLSLINFNLMKAQK